MHAIRQKCRPKHQVLILKCYPRTTKGAVDVKPNSSELSYLLYYATTRRSKVQKVGAFLEKKTASDVWRARIGNVQVTLQILAALIEKAPRDLPLYAHYVLAILNQILRSRDITMVESSIPTFEAFCEHSDGASLSADQDYLQQYEQIVTAYTSFASRKQEASKTPISAPVQAKWRNVGLQAIRSVASAEALASVAGRQLNIIVPVLLENLWTNDQGFLDRLNNRVRMEEKSTADKLTRRRSSFSTVRTVDTTEEPNAATLGTAADVDKAAEEDLGLLAMKCLKQLFVANNRTQIWGGANATLKFIADKLAQKERVIDEGHNGAPSKGWAITIFALMTRWTPVQDRYVILVTAMDALVRSPLLEDNLQQQVVLTTMVDSLLQSDINLIGLSVMDVLLGLIQHVLRTLQLGGAAHLQQVHESEQSDPSPPQSIGGEVVTTPSSIRKELLAKLQSCIGNLATHIYYADQISDMVSAILLRLKPSPTSSVPTPVAAIANPEAASAALTEKADLTEDSATHGFFSFDTAKITALEAIKMIFIVASNRKKMTGGGLARSRVQIKVWEGTQWLLRDSDGRVRKAYVDALLTWLDKEMIKSDLRAFEYKPKGSNRLNRDDSAIGLSKRALSNASYREKNSKLGRTTFLQLLHLAIYENALQYVDNEGDIVLLHLLLANLVAKLGVNAVKDGLPMIFRLQEDIQVAEAPLAKVRIGSLCHGYFWILTENFDFVSSVVGRAIHAEIFRRQKKGFWVEAVRLPPLPIDQISMPSSTETKLAMETVESESLLPFDDRFQMVKLISLAYGESLASPPSSPPTSPGRSFSHPILSMEGGESEVVLPDQIKDQMMAEWNRETVIATVQDTSKTVSLNGSKAGTAHRNFLAVNSNINESNGGTQSPQGQLNNRSRPNSTSYGLVGSLGTLHKLRKGSGQSPSPISDSSRASITRVDQLKRVLSGQQGGIPGSRQGRSQSDASSDSMVSMDFTVSELSFNPGHDGMGRSGSQRGSNDRTRSKSRDRISIGDPSPLSSHQPVTGESYEDDENPVPPVPPLPSSLVGEPTAVQDHAPPMRKRSLRQTSQNRSRRSSRASWGGEDNGVVLSLQNLLKGIEVGNGIHEKGNVARPSY